MKDRVEETMELRKLDYDLTVCKVDSVKKINFENDFFFMGKTEEEISLVCLTEDVPEQTIEREDGWKGFRVQAILDFSLVGILSKISGILAEKSISIFAVSTYNTDYILVKADDFYRAMEILSVEGYKIV